VAYFDHDPIPPFEADYRAGSNLRDERVAPALLGVIFAQNQIALEAHVAHLTVPLKVPTPRSAAMTGPLLNDPNPVVSVQTERG
jgi:hypothetical protein